MAEMVDFIVWTSSNSPYAPITRVRVPKDTILPAVGVWRQVKAAGETILTFDPSQSADGWLAWAIKGCLRRANPEDGLKAVYEMAGNHYDIWVGYVRPGAAASFGVGYKRRRRLNIKFIAPGETCDAHADDFAAAELLLP